MTLDQGSWIGIGLFLCCLVGVFWYAYHFCQETPHAEMDASVVVPFVGHASTRDERRGVPPAAPGVRRVRVAKRRLGR